MNVRCPACNATISRAAERCPHCRHPRPDGGWPKPPNVFGWAVALAVAAYFVTQNFATQGSGNPSPPEPAAVAHKAAPAPQAQPVATVRNSPLDGSVYQVERFLKTNLKDPDSFEAIEWSPVVTVDNGTGYVSRVKYRAKNSFGGYTISTQIFFLDANGSVVSAADGA